MFNSSKNSLTLLCPRNEPRTLQTVPAVLSPSLATTSYHDRNHQRGLSGAMPERQAGRQAGIKATQLQQGNFFSSLPPSLPLSSPFLAFLSHSLDFLPEQRNVFHHLATRQARGQPALPRGQTTCMQLGLAWLAKQRALKDRAGQDRVSQTGLLSLSLPPSLPLSLEAGHSRARGRGRLGECSLDENAAVALLSSLARSYANL